MCDMTDVCVTWRTRSWLNNILYSDTTRVRMTRLTSIIALKYAIKQSTRSWLDDILYSYSDMTRVCMTRLTSIIALNSFSTHERMICSNALEQITRSWLNSFTTPKPLMYVWHDWGTCDVTHSFVTCAHSWLRHDSCMCDKTHLYMPQQCARACCRPLRLSAPALSDVCVTRQCVAVCCSVLQCVPSCCSVLHRVTLCCSMMSSSASFSSCSVWCMC